MTRNELQAQYLYNSNIALDYFKMDNIEAFCCVLNDKKHICISPKRERSKTSEFWLIEHELSHLDNQALYSFGASSSTIAKAERKANDKMILKFDLPNQVLKLLKRGFEKYEICNYLELTYDVIDCCIDYLYRKGYIYNNEY